MVTILIQKPFVQLISGCGGGSVFFGNAGSFAHKCTQKPVLQDVHHSKHLGVKSHVFPDTETIEVLSSADRGNEGVILALFQKLVCCLCREHSQRLPKRYAYSFYQIKRQHHILSVHGHPKMHCDKLSEKNK